MVNKTYFFHTVCLISVFTTGGMLIYFPSKNNIKGSLLGLIIAIIFSLVLSLFLNKIPTPKNDDFKLLKGALFCPLPILLIVLSGGNYINYVKDFRMPNTSKILISLIFLSVCLFLAFMKKSVILKTALIAFIYVFFSVVILFVLSFSQFDFTNILPLKFDAYQVGKGFLKAFAESFLSGIILVFFLFNNLNNKRRKIYLLGFVLSGVVLLIAGFNILFIFGENLSSKLPLPYAQTMSVISLGNVFSRLEGFSYINYFICTALKTSASLYVLKKVLKNFFNIKSNRPLYFITFLLFLSFSFINVKEIIGSSYFIFMLFLFEILFVISLFINKKSQG